MSEPKNRRQMFLQNLSFSLCQCRKVQHDTSGNLREIYILTCPWRSVGSRRQPAWRPTPAQKWEWRCSYRSSVLHPAPERNDKKSYRFIKCKSIHLNNSVKPALNFLSYSTMAICGFHYLSKCAEAAEKTNEMISPRCYLFHILMGKHWFKLNGLLCCLVLQLK